MGIETEEITDSWVPFHRDLGESDHKLKGGKILQTKFLILFYTLFLFYFSAFKKHTVKFLFNVHSLFPSAIRDYWKEKWLNISLWKDYSNFYHRHLPSWWGPQMSLSVSMLWVWKLASVCKLNAGLWVSSREVDLAFCSPIFHLIWL